MKQISMNEMEKTTGGIGCDFLIRKEGPGSQIERLSSADTSVVNLPLDESAFGPITSMLVAFDKK